MKLSIVIPCYNEHRTLQAVVDRVLAVDLGDTAREIVIVDDGSTDASPEIAKRLAESHPDTVRSIVQPLNQGKGAAVRAGFTHATGDVVIVQDADMEYDPGDYVRLLERFRDPAVKVVYGSRILGSKNFSYHSYYWGGRIVTWATNFIYGCHITDEPTCYKLFRREILDELNLQSNGFEFCPEITAKVLRCGYKIHEVPISYSPRSFAEGKKISWRDGIIALWTLARYRFWRKQPNSPTVREQ